MLSSREKLKHLVQALKAAKVHALIVPSEDAHQSEYVAERDERRAWVSGFTGSAGTALIVLNEQKEAKGEGFVWVDGRYFTQADTEVDTTCWSVMKMGMEGVPQLSELIKKYFADLKFEQVNVAFDPRFASKGRVDAWTAGANSSENSKNKTLDVTFIPVVGIVDKVQAELNVTFAKLANQAVFPYSLEYAGESVESKVSRIRNYIRDNYLHEGSENSDFIFVVHDLTEVCWLLNLRGRNFIFGTPVFFGYIIITAKLVFLFADFDSTADKFDVLTKYLDELKESKIVSLEYFGYDDFTNQLENIIATTFESSKSETKLHKNVILLPDNTNYHIYNTCKMTLVDLGTSEVDAEAFLKAQDESVVTAFKAIKNEVEYARLKETSLNDSVAVCEFLHWLEISVTENCGITEVDAADKLENFRSEIPDFAGVSFPTISAYGSNAAIIHYQPERKSPLMKTLSTDNVYLCDSGGQYSTGGTTDVTRTMHYGTPNEDMKKWFTLVLEGHAQLAMATYREGTLPTELDKLARQPIRNQKEDYRHGTGHGVGAFLSVHEHPPYVGTRAWNLEKPDVMQAGMCLSNEPGFYLENHYGFRIESVMFVKQFKPIDEKDSNEDLLMNETLTLIPMQKRLIDPNFLSPEAKNWLNAYHAEILQKVGAKLKEQNKLSVLKWLQDATSPI